MTNLGCGEIYDWSTGLIYKNGRYFDPTLGIWLALAPLVIGGGWFVRGKRGRRREKEDKRYVLLLLLLLLAMGLSGCGDKSTAGTPTVEAVVESTKDCTPTPEATPDAPSATQAPADEPVLPTPIPTSTQRPTETPMPYPYPVPPNLSPPTVSVFGDDRAIRGEHGFWYKDPVGHNGIDVIPSRFSGNNSAVIGSPVFALYAGYLVFGPAGVDRHRAYLRIGATVHTVHSVEYELMYSHIIRTRNEGDIEPGNQIGTIMDITNEVPEYRQGTFHHLHLEIRKRANKSETFDPEFLIHPVS